MKKTLLILAAGMGSRYGGLKQLDPIGPSGETILDYSVYDAISAGFDKVVFVIRRDIEEEFKKIVGSRYSNRVEVAYAYQQLDALPEGYSCPEERQKPWGTGQAVLSAKDEINEPFLLINADDYYGTESYKCAADMLDKLPKGEIASAMVGFQLDKTLSDFGGVSRGLCKVDGQGNLQGVEEIHKIERVNGTITSDSDYTLDGSESVSMNMWLFTPEVFVEIEKQFSDFLDVDINTPKSEFFIPSVVNTLLNEKGINVPVERSASEWFGVTFREDREFVVKRVEGMVADGIYPNSLWGA